MVRSLVRARAWRAWYRLRWWLVDRRALRRTRVRRVAGLELVVLPGVLDPALFFSSEVLVEGVVAVVEPGATMLDLGTGTGIAALAAARQGAARVVATDVDATALRCARANVALHGLGERIDVREGDMWQPVEGELFDVVAFNPPYQMGEHRDDLDRALRATPDLATRFASGLAEHLSVGGCAVLVLSTNGDPDAYLGPLRDAGFAVRPLATRDRGSETLTAWQVVRESPVQPHP